MLIFTRRPGEQIIIGDDIRIAILKVDGNQVRVGIDAPKEVSVHRKEIYDKILAQKEEHASDAEAKVLEKAFLAIYPNVKFVDCTLVKGVS